MEITPEIKEKIAAVVQRYQLALLVLFGSQASGRTHPESDVDIAYLADQKLSFDDEVLLNFDLTEIFRNDKVSLVNLKTAPPLLLKQIVTKAAVLYERLPHFFTEVFLNALRSYDEAKPIFDLRSDYLARRINEYHHA